MLSGTGISTHSICLRGLGAVTDKMAGLTETYRAVAIEERTLN